MKWTATLDVIKAETTTNRAQRRHWSQRAELTSSVRHDFATLALDRRNPAPRFAGRVLVTFQLECRRTARAKLPDVDAGYLLAKWALDGIVDARAIPDDTGEHVAAITHRPPVWSPDDRDAITIRLEDEPRDES